MCDKSNLIKKLYEAYCKCDLLLTDSREVASAVKNGKKVMFFALKGDRFDANDFVDNVIEDGATCIVTSRKDIIKEGVIFQFDDTLEALQLLANHHRKSIKAKIVVITGSNGKTTTKELLSMILLQKYNVSFTIGNLNNHIGVPLTLLTISEDDDFAVVEHGANHKEEISLLCSISEPDYGIITNIGRAHLDGFGGEEGVIKAKGELFDNLALRGKEAFYNSTIDILKSMVNERKELKTIPYSSDIISIVEDDKQKGVTFLYRERKIESKLYGDYNMLNIAAAIAIGSHFGISDSEIATAIESYTPHNMRSQLIKSCRNSIIIDAYNANPSSMMIAIENFHKDPSKREKLYILGQMNELGSYSRDEHLLIAKKLDSLGAKSILIGSEFEEGASKYGFEWYETVEKAISDRNFKLITDHNILLKGSRSIGIEKMLQKL